MNLGLVHPLDGPGWTGPNSSPIQPPEPLLLALCKHSHCIYIEHLLFPDFYSYNIRPNKGLLYRMRYRKPYSYRLATLAVFDGPWLVDPDWLISHQVPWVFQNHKTKRQGAKSRHVCAKGIILPSCKTYTSQCDGWIDWLSRIADCIQILILGAFCRA